MTSIKELAEAINKVMSTATAKQKNDIENLYANAHGFPIKLDKRNAPAGETLRSCQIIGSRINVLIGTTEKYGMNVVGKCNYEDMVWQMNQGFRAAFDFLNGIEPPKIYENNDELKEIHEQLETSISKALMDTESNRKNRIANANDIPKRIKVTTYVFLRNPDIVAESLIRANGRCEKCCNPAPFFKKSDGQPYLEVHHKIPLALDGKDSIENTIAICPNCHRETHYG